MPLTDYNDLQTKIKEMETFKKQMRGMISQAFEHAKYHPFIKDSEKDLLWLNGAEKNILKELHLWE